MAKNEAIARAIATDPYLKERKAPTEPEQQLYLKEVSFVCPLCGKILQHRKRGKRNKLYEVAHIFPNSPTEEQYERLSALPRLGSDSESFENKIALCKDCHDQQDYHTTVEDYLTLDVGGREEEYFALHVRGESMINAGILPGDLVVVHRQVEAHNGEIVVALLGDEATVKRFSRRDGHVWLLPENEAYAPIDGTRAQILGKVAYVMRQYN